jgi:16S rRNA (guanine527-N7)-methyltransferase
MTAPPDRSKAFNILSKGSHLLGLSPGEERIASMVAHLEMLIRWGKRVNLTSIRGVHDLAVLHFLDSLTIFKVVAIGEYCRVLDIGTGGGFPGVVMKIVDQSMRPTLLDRSPKKIVFLKHLCRELGLQGVEFLNIAIESLTDDPRTEPFDLVVSRAVISDPGRWESLAPLVAEGGSLIRMAGPSLRENDVISDNLRETARWEGELPFADVSRKVIRYERI